MQRISFPNTVRTVRDINRARVLRCIEQWPGISRKEITQKIGLTDAAVSRISREIIDCGIVVENANSISNGRPGRRHIGLNIQPGGGYVFAACLTVSDKSLTLIDLAGEPVAKDTLPDNSVSELDSLTRVLATRADELRKEAGVPRNRILGMAAVLAGSVNHKTGFVNVSSLDALSQTPFASALEERIEIPVQLETVGNALNIAHKRNEKSFGNEQTILLVHVAMGMGASWIIDGIPYRAEHDERSIAHIPTGGGRNGPSTSLLAAASGYAILCSLHGTKPDPAGQDFATHFEPEVLTQAINSANEGEAKATALFQAAGRKLGHHLFSVCAALRPDQITLAGPVPQITIYENAVSEGLSAAYARVGLESPPVAVSPMGFLRATELFALEEFLYGSRLDVKRLLAD